MTIIIRDRVTSRGSQVLDLTCVPGPDVALATPLSRQDIKNTYIKKYKYKKFLNSITSRKKHTVLHVDTFM